MWTHKTKSLLVIGLFVCFIPGYLTITCYTCENELRNENCNTAEMTCDGSCYTEIKKLQATGKRYYKGCMETDRCDRLETLRDRKYCPYFPSECTYCCLDKDLCNAFNGTPEMTSQILVVIFALSTGMVMFL